VCFIGLKCALQPMPALSRPCADIAFQLVD